MKYFSQSVFADRKTFSTLTWVLACFNYLAAYANPFVLESTAKPFPRETKASISSIEKVRLLRIDILSAVALQEPMATASPSQTVFQFFRPAKRRLTCDCLSRQRSPFRPVHSAQRNVSTATPQFSEMEVDGKPRPRWSYTPPAMAAPVRSRQRPEGVTPLKINSDPQKLDQMYIRFLGKDGDKMLREETKWLAVTHKSFDHGRRGFNDRLSFLGTSVIFCFSTDTINLIRLATQERG
jgi:hypothetical protein